ncbi:DinB family protein [Paenibacillus antri]|uniref:DinB family protein n=1 Tax=Paenibacillus antri TaxID=2582848 RepID=A0A5R9G0F3_9BACL|nr:DinB family protein [Paenibacillus antri]TLS48479.1 DinB family protein [Paenibacillus antri]
MVQRPASEEYNPYFAVYIDRVPDGDIVEQLRRQQSTLVELLDAIPSEKLTYRYAPGKWSVAQLIGHIADTERVMSYRLLRVARGDRTPLPGFDQDLFVANSNFDEWTVGSLKDEYEAVRKSTLSLLQGLPASAFAFRGVVGGNETSTAALAYIIAGHELHHVDILRRLYL